MIWVWLIVCTLLALFAELAAGNHGVALPVIALVGCYHVIVAGWRAAFAPTVIAGSLADLALFRALPVFALLFPVVVLVAHFWQEHGDCRHAALQAFPGAAVGLAMSTGALLLLRAGELTSAPALLRGGIGIAVGTAAGAVILPVLCMSLDAAAFRMGLPQYRHAQEEADSEH